LLSALIIYFTDKLGLGLLGLSLLSFHQKQTIIKMSVDDKKTTTSCAIENVEMNMTVESSDVVKLVLQYLKENNLLASMQQLQRETGIALNTVDNIDSFQNDIKLGRWDSVLNQLTSLKLPMSKMVSRFSL
jgi:hypothetical protein